MSVASTVAHSWLSTSYLRGVIAVWQRHALVWQKLAGPSILANVADPLLAFIAFGYGLGGMLPAVNGQPYLHYLACGTLALSAMNAATFEALYSAFSRMHVQKTWDAMLNTPLTLSQVVLGEWLWAASKSAMSTTAVMLVVAVLGIGDLGFWLGCLPLLWLGALLFAALGLCVNAHAQGYDFFMFYFTLFLTPMTFLSGAFFPRQQLPDWLQTVATYLPLSQLVDAVRALLARQYADIWWPVLYLVAMTVIMVILAIHQTQRRFARY